MDSPVRLFNHLDQKGGKFGLGRGPETHRNPTGWRSIAIAAHWAMLPNSGWTWQFCLFYRKPQHLMSGVLVEISLVRLEAHRDAARVRMAMEPDRRRGRLLGHARASCAIAFPADRRAPLRRHSLWILIEPCGVLRCHRVDRACRDWLVNRSSNAEQLMRGELEHARS